MPPRISIPSRRAPVVEDISPPSSPDSHAPRTVSADISPVDTLPDASRLNIGQHNIAYYYRDVSPIPAPLFSHPYQQPSQSTPPPKPPPPRPQQQQQQQQLQQHYSSIPVPVPRRDQTPHRSVSREQLRAPSSSSKSMAIKWDSYSGEPTTSVNGRSGSARPGEYAPGFAQESLRNAQAMLRKIRPGAGGNRGQARATEERQERHRPEEQREYYGPEGSVGRPAAAVVANPPSYMDQAEYARLVRRDGRLASWSHGGPSAAPPPLSPYGPPPPGPETPFALQPSGMNSRRAVPSSIYSQDTAVPSPLTSPIASSIPVPVPALSRPGQAPTCPSPFPHGAMTPRDSPRYPDSSDAERAIRRKQPPVAPPPPPPHHAPQPSYSSSIHSEQPPRSSSLRPLPPRFDFDDSWSQPASSHPLSPSVAPRSFSAEAPSPSPFPPPPSPRQESPSSRQESPSPRQEEQHFRNYTPISSTPPQIATPVLDRKRPRIVTDDMPPRPSATPEPIVISIKSTWLAPKPVRPNTEDSSSSSDEGAKPLNPLAGYAVGDKALPPDPNEASGDRIGRFNARLSALGNRRINITLVIRKMTEMMPEDKITNSADVQRKREEEKKKIEGFRAELAEIQREEYELGLKLHRAYKRLDRDTDYEPTSLWVRRATAA